MRDSQASDRLIALLLLGVLALSPPLLGVFRAEAFVLGVPVLFFYVFAVWAALIACLAAIVETGRRDEPPRED
jgi:hypothetical protein